MPDAAVTAFILRKLLRAGLTVLVVLVLTFAGARLSGSPFDMLADDAMSASDRAALAAQFGIDRPLPAQFAAYVTALAQGDLGMSLIQRRPVGQIYAEALPTTLRLTGAALLAILLAGIPLGVLSAARAGGTAAGLADGVIFACYAVPHFLFGIILILVFSLALGWLPTIGQDSWRSFVMPALSLAAGLGATIARFLGQGLSQALAADYIRTARAGGVGERRVVLALALRNAMLPVLTILGVHLGGLFAGSIIIENLFAMHGIGQAFIGAVQQRDYPVLQFGVIAVALVVVAANMTVDLLYVWIDPRIRRGGAA